MRVTSPTGFKVIDNLRASNFLVVEHQISQSLCALVHRPEPSSIGVLVDTSGSMDSALGFKALAIAKAGVNQLLDTSGPQDEYFLESVNDSQQMKCVFTQDISALRSRLSGRARGKTALIDAIYTSLRAMHSARYLNRALVVLSDAYNNAGVHGLGALVQALADSPVPIFLVIPVDPVERAHPRTTTLESDAKSRQALTNVAEASGGQAINVSSKEDMIKLSTQIAAAIRSPYVLYFKPTGERNAEIGDIHVAVTGVHPRPRVMYRGVIRYTK